MHAHMLEKVGSFLRIEKLKKKGPVPQYDLEPVNVTFQETNQIIIGIIISFASINIIKSSFSFINSNFMGYLFQSLENFETYEQTY